MTASLNDLFFVLRKTGIPISIGEYLDLLNALRQGVTPPTLENFYHLARLTLVKSETHFDKFDKAFAQFFAKNASTNQDSSASALAPLFNWANQQHESPPSIPEAPEHASSLETLTGSGQPNQEAVRIGGTSRDQQARKTWEQRNYRDYDADNQLSDRNMQLALRRLRKYVRQSVGEEELDMEGTIRATANNAGWLEIRMHPVRRNRFKVVILLDIGGTMLEHANLASTLFSAAKSEFKNMEFYYFHNCIYDHLWHSAQLDRSATTPTWHVLHRYARETRVIFVGDAKMRVEELSATGGSVMGNNDEPGKIWLQRIASTYPNFIWLNPEPEESWDFRESITHIRAIMQNRMYPLTVKGIEQGMRLLSR